LCSSLSDSNIITMRQASQINAVSNIVVVCILLVKLSRGLWYKRTSSTHAQGKDYYEPEYKDYQTQKCKKHCLLVHAAFLSLWLLSPKNMRHITDPSW
jgi:hypothetical protein